MKLNLNHIISPCHQCYIHGTEYSPDDAGCQRCEYNIAVQILKVVLKFNDYCTLCKNRDNLEWCDRKYNVNYGHRSKKYRNLCLIIIKAK